MKEDLIKVTAILTADAPAEARPGGGRGPERGPVEVSGGPPETMEKDLEEVKEDLEKVSQILRNGSIRAELAEGGAEAAGVEEDWVLLTASEIEEAKKMASRDVREPVLRENRGNRGAPRPKAIKDSGDLKEYLLDAPVSPKTKDDVPGQRTKAAGSTTAQEAPRAHAKEPGRAEEVAGAGALLHVPGAPAPAPPVSPVVEETPIGSIRDKVKALQQKVEAEQKSRSATGSKLPVTTKAQSHGTSKQGPPKGPPKGPPRSPKAQPESPAETMSVRELMQAFQTGRDPSKSKSGLFEHKTSVSWRPPDVRTSGPAQCKSATKAKASPAPAGREVSLDSKPSRKEAQVPPAGLSQPADSGSAGLDDSPDSLKEEGGADWPGAGSADGSPRTSSEDSYKHEGLATPGTSPESVGCSPEAGRHTGAERLGVGTAGGPPSTDTVLPGTSRETTDQHATSESRCVKRSESKRPKLTKRVSETVETFLSDDESPDPQLDVSLVALTASRSSFQGPEGLSLPLKQDSDLLSPLADDSLTISHRDSLDGSPLPEENSSHKSPDSIEPSPTNETPPRDSLESSPVEQRSHVSLLSSLNLPSRSSSHPQPLKLAELPHRCARGRLLQDPEASAEDNSCEQTSQMTSSGKSPLSPDTPSSEEVSYEVNPPVNPPDPTFHFLPSEPSAIPEDPEEGSPSCSSEAERRLTPEEEMFKMAARVKTFDEMEQDARSYKNSRRDLCPSDPRCERLEPSSETSGPGRAAEAPNVDLSVDPRVKAQPSFPLSAGLHEGPHMKASEGHHSVSEEKVGSGGKTSVTSNAQNRTDEQKEQSLKKSRGTTGEDSKVQEPGTAGPEGAGPKKDSNVTDEMKGDQMVHTGASKSRAGAPTETLKAEEGVYDEAEEDEEVCEPPKTESKGVTARVGAESWSAVREDDAAFAACAQEEEQKILNLAVEHQSLQATPDTTPGRTPTEESTPTSEPNPFLFQEGKLFEMTRSGAIDMSKRSYEEEGGAFAFFQIGEKPLEEPLSEDARQDGAGATAETEVGLNLTLEVKTDERAESPRQSAPEVDQHASVADAAKSKIPKMGLSASAKLAKKDQTPAEGGDGRSDRKASEGADVGPDPSEQVITNVQTAESTVTRSVYSQQTQESSDSSPEESKSVLEAPKPANKSKQNAPSGAKKLPGKPQAKAAPSARGKPAIPCPARAATPSTAGKKESVGCESKSKIPIKAGAVKADSPAKRAESSQDKKLRVPAKKDARRKSEADAGPSAGLRTKTTSPKAKSFCEGESSRPPAAKKVPESAKSRSFQSRLPVRGKSGQTSAPATPTKEKSQPLQESIEFFEEIGDEAAKLVARLAQADREAAAAAANSDEESGLLEPSVMERESFPEVHFHPSGDVFPVRPLWDHPVETQMQRSPDHRAQSQGTASTPGALLYLLCLASAAAVKVLPLCLLCLGPTLVEESRLLGNNVATKMLTLTMANKRFSVLIALSLH